MDSDDFRAIIIGIVVIALELGVSFILMLGVIKLVKYCWFF